VANQSLGATTPALPNGVPWTSVRKLYAAGQKTPGLFVQTPTQAVASERARIGTSEWIRETATAGYLQGEARLLRNRLTLVTGVRWEQTQDVGFGPLVDLDAAFVHDAQGRLVLDAQGRTIRRPEAGAPNSPEEVRHTNIERGHRAAHNYQGYYPSLNTTYQVTDRFQLRLGYARTYGRPDFYSIVPRASNAREDQFLGVFLASDATAFSRGLLYVNNVALKPWSAQNYELSAEYYSDTGGLLTLGVFQKNVRDFFAEVTRPITANDLAALGLDSSYQTWKITTQTNGGSARLGGASLNVKQSLQTLGRFGRYFAVTANVTQLQLNGEQEADFTAFIKRSANWGLDFQAGNLVLLARWNYRGQKKGEPEESLGPDAYHYTASRTTMDVNLVYRLKKQVEVFLHARNLFNAPSVTLAYGAQTPAYARQWSTAEYGAQFTAGIKGAF
jgi:TonB-dependent receptor